MKIINVVVTVSLLFISNNAFAQNRNLNITTGYSVTTGKYNQTQNTIIEYVPLTALYHNEDWQLELTVPFLRITGNGSVIPGTHGSMVFSDFNSGSFGAGRGMMNSGASNTTTIINSGLGDVITKLTHPIYSNSDQSVQYVMAASVKFATADVQKGLGTGENDYSVDITGSFAISTSIPYVTLGYTFTGDTAQITYQNPIYASAGIMQPLDTKKSLFFAYDFQQAGIAGADNFQQVSVSLSWKQSTNRTLIVSALMGLTKSSPDFGTSLLLTHNF